VLDRAGLELEARAERRGESAHLEVSLAGPLAELASGTVEIRAMAATPVELVHEAKLDPGAPFVITEDLSVAAGTPIQVTALLDADGEPVRIQTVTLAP
jgi:hypothetical protein